LVSVSESVVWRVAMTSPRITYAPRPDATPEGELKALASIYRFVLNSAHKNAAGRTTTNGGDEKERSRNVSLAKTRIP
jgi:hypothetical protein